MHALPLILLACALCFATVSRAAESYDNCSGFVDSLPATIGAQGVWCLRKDLSTGMASGAAIVLGVNNVTLDCNGFKLGGLAAGPSTQAVGVYSLNRLNATVRDCNIRGFRDGVSLLGDAGGGHLVEDNRLDFNTRFGIEVSGDGSTVTRNAVRDTGGSLSDPVIAIAILVRGGVDVLDNTISGVAPVAPAGGVAHGIEVEQINGGSISGNRVRGLVGTGAIRAILVGAGGGALVGNQVFGSGAVGSVGLQCADDTVRAKDNVIADFTSAIFSCGDGGGNDVSF